MSKQPSHQWDNRPADGDSFQERALESYKMETAGVLCLPVFFYWIVLFILTVTVAHAQFVFTTSTISGQITITQILGSGAALMIPDTINGYPVTSIGTGAFKAGDATSVSIGNNVTSIGDSAFGGSSLTSLTLGKKVASIGDSAFEGCGMTGVIFPASVTSIANDAFNSCSYLKYVIFLGNAPTFGFGGSGVFYNTASNFTGYCFSGATGFSEAVNAGVYSPVTVWLISKGIPYNANIQSAPNRDGVSLLMAYALNLDPTWNQSALLPKPVFTGNQMSLTFYAGSTGVTYSVEASADLKSWSAITLSGSDSNGKVTASVPISGQNRFMRLKIGR